MNVLTWVNDNGREIVFNRQTYFYDRVTDSLAADEQVFKAPWQDGASTFAVTLARPLIHISGSMTVLRTGDRKKKMDDAVDELNTAFLPHIFGVLTERRAGTDRMIRCRPAARPVFGPVIQNSRTVDIDFIADMPRWVEATETVLELGREVGGFRFPLRLPTRMGFYMRDAVIDNNSGDYIFPVIEIYTVSELIRVTNETMGLHIEIKYPIGERQKMVIDTLNTEAYLHERDGLSGEWHEIKNVSDWLTHDSDYWPLQVGRNFITLRNERPDVTVIASVRFNRPM
ncbi:MAG: phage tail family protein [Oscillospiraceae bacterium]|nr:phage tail family protein [Oscillospiraceae bacterium]